MTIPNWFLLFLWSRQAPSWAASPAMESDAETLLGFPPLPAHPPFLHHDEPHHPPPPPLSFHPQPGSTRLVDILGSAFRRFWHTSHTVLRLDVRRAVTIHGPVLPSSSPRSSSRPSSYRGDDDVDGGWIQGINAGGARLKLMQTWEFPDKETGLPGFPWTLNFGFGGKIEMDKGGHLIPQMRLKTKHCAFYILPLPLFELRGRWPLGGSRLAIDIRYRIPLLNVEHIWESPTAQLFVNLYNPLGTGYHLTPGGLEFDEHVINIGEHTKLRVAASLDFPRRFPLEDGEQPIRVHINRMGIKTRVS